MTCTVADSSSPFIQQDSDEKPPTKQMVGMYTIVAHRVSERQPAAGVGQRWGVVLKRQALCWKIMFGRRLEID